MNNTQKEQRIRIIANLTDAGCDANTAERYVNSDDEKEKKRILDDHRKLLLDNLHKCQKQIDCLDYLIYSERKKSV